MDIANLSDKEKKKAYPTNPCQIASVQAKVTAGTTPVTSANPVPPMAKTSSFIVVSPLVDFNAKKRKYDDEDGRNCLRAVAPYWAILHAAPGEEGNMQFVNKVIEEKGYIGKDWPVFKKCDAYRVEIPYLTNTKKIQSGDILLLPPK